MWENFETTHLIVARPDLENLILLAVLAMASAATVRRRAVGGFLDRDETSQLKGLAILMVILGHLWVHVASPQPELVFSGDAVALFFVLSGFGLSLSYRDKQPDLASYVRRRLHRVMVPYWAVTVFVVLLDYALLRRTVAPEDLALTVVGLNLTPATQHLDYARWFVSFLLFWYVLFYAARRIGPRIRIDPAWMLLGCGAGIFVLDYYVTRFGWDQALAFPMGCILARYHGRLRGWLDGRPGRFLGIAAVCLGVGIGYKILLVHVLPAWLPSIGRRGIGELNSLLLSAGAIALVASMGACGRQSRFLAFAGLVSYELFLLHGVFLIKYNPVFPLFSADLVPLAFMLLLVFLLALGYAFSRLVPQ